MRASLDPTVAGLTPGSVGRRPRSMTATAGWCIPIGAGHSISIFRRSFGKDQSGVRIGDRGIAPLRSHDSPQSIPIDWIGSSKRTAALEQTIAWAAVRKRGYLSGQQLYGDRPCSACWQGVSIVGRIFVLTGGLSAGDYTPWSSRRDHAVRSTGYSPAFSGSTRPS
jgi:hypothetical protein